MPGCKTTLKYLFTSESIRPGVEIDVFLDYLDAIVFYEWGDAWYRISQDTADAIQRQFHEFQELASCKNQENEVVLF